VCVCACVCERERNGKRDEVRLKRESEYLVEIFVMCVFMQILSMMSCIFAFACFHQAKRNSKNAMNIFFHIC